MKNKSGKHRHFQIPMRTQFFIPITIIFIILPLVIWRIFVMTSHDYIYQTSLNQLNHLLFEVGNIADQTITNYDDHEQAKKTAKKFYQHLTDLLTSERSSAQFLILNDDFAVIYPAENFESQVNSNLVYNYFSALHNESEDPEKNQITQVEIHCQNYLVTFRDISVCAGDDSRYLIGYVPVDNINNLLEHAKYLMLIISILMTGICLVIMWFLIGGIIRPIKKLCAHTSRIGAGEFSPITESTSVSEITQLNTAVNEMVAALKHSDESQKIFFQNVSHELRTPLMSIGGYVQGLQCGIFEDNTQAINVIADENKRLTELVDGILTLTRMDSKRQSVALHEIDLKDFFKALFLRLDGMAMTNHISLTCQSEKDIDFTIDADDELLNRIFQNLLSNCIRYANDIVKVCISREMQDQKEFILIRVIDDGPGFTDTDVNHLFERFYKGTKGHFGIGLAIAKSASEYMGASIAAKNIEPHGTSFEVRFPKDRFDM